MSSTTHNGHVAHDHVHREGCGHVEIPHGIMSASPRFAGEALRPGTAELADQIPVQLSGVTSRAKR